MFIFIRIVTPLTLEHRYWPLNMLVVLWSLPIHSVRLFLSWRYRIFVFIFFQSSFLWKSCSFQKHLAYFKCRKVHAHWSDWRILWLPKHPSSPRRVVVSSNQNAGCDSKWTHFFSLPFRTEDFCHDDGHTLSPKEIHSYLSRVMYNRRNRMNPYYNQLIVGGFKHGKRFVMKPSSEICARISYFWHQLPWLRRYGWN